jgi:geranylgeranyl diphosphate synthase, type I
MALHDFFREARRDISLRLSSYLDGCAVRFAGVPRWGKDASERLKSFALSGKMLRGCLVLLGHAISGGGDRERALDCAAAMELAQAGFLVHDDIMDRDRMRRGMPSVYWQYAEEAARSGLSEPRRSGESLGTCAGDFSFFLAFDLMAAAGAPPSLLALCAREFAAVALAQMEDIWYGSSGGVPSEKAILSLYARKTGRYSCALPLMAGAALAGADDAGLEALSRLGEAMGVLFQIRDDELGVFGDESDLGKPVGSDVREGKKTIFVRALLDALPEKDAERALALFGSPAPDAVEEIRVLMEESGARARVRAIADAIAAETRGMIAALGLPDGPRGIMESLLGFILERER